MSARGFSRSAVSPRSVVADASQPVRSALPQYFIKAAEVAAKMLSPTTLLLAAAAPAMYYAALLDRTTLMMTSSWVRTTMRRTM